VAMAAAPTEGPTAAEAGAGSGAAQSAEAATEEEDDDPVVQECDIYLNRMYDPPDFVGDMYVLQYPLRPDYRPYGDQGDLDRVELKQKSRRLKFTYKLKHGDNYDEDGVVSEKHGQKHVLSSTVVANPSCSYAVGVIHRGRMTVTPVRAVAQLRPDFEVFDRLRAQQQRVTEPGADAFDAAAASANLQAAGEGGRAAESSDSGAEEARAVVDAGDMVAASTVRVEYLPSGGAVQAASGAEPIEAEDPWTRLDYYNSSSEEAQDIHRKHIVFPAAAAADAEAGGYAPDHPKLQALALDGDRQAFLARMCGQAVPGRERKAKAEAEPQDGLSAYVLSRMPAERQVEAVVRHFGVVSYSRQLRKRLPPNTLRAYGSDERLLQMLQSVAVLVAGNWVLKSNLAGFEGTEASARDMLLCLLANKEGKLTKEEYDKWGMIFGKHVSKPVQHELTLSFAEFDQEHFVWRLKNPVDEDFKRKFPTLVKEYKEWWETHRQKLVLQLRDARAMKGPSSSSAMAGNLQRQRYRLVGEIRELLTLGAMTLSELRRAVQKRNSTVAIREEDLTQALQHKDCDAVQVRDLWMLSSTGKEENDAFRSVLFGLFRQRDSVSKKDIFAEYERLYGKPCQLSDFLVRQLVREIAEKADRDNYVLKGTLLKSAEGSSGGGPA